MSTVWIQQGAYTLILIFACLFNQIYLVIDINHLNFSHHILHSMSHVYSKIRAHHEWLVVGHYIGNQCTFSILENQSCDFLTNILKVMMICQVMSIHYICTYKF